MKPNPHAYSGKSFHRYLFLAGVTAVIVMFGSYWYIEYYSKRNSNYDTVVRQTGVASHQVPNPTSNIPGLSPFVTQSIDVSPQAQPVVMPATNTFAAVVRSMMPSVVNVSATSANNPPPVAGEAPAQQQPSLKFARPFSGIAQESIGSGIIVTADGYVLTNFHVVEQAKHINVTVFNDIGSKRYHADVVGLDEMRDLALLKITAKNPLRPAALGDSEQMQVGDSVIAIGSPFGLDQTVSKGIVSGKEKIVNIGGTIHKGLLQTDAAINRGNSGGPLVERGGTVIGINTAIYTTTSAFAGIGFAIPTKMAQDFLEEFIKLPNVQPNFAGQPVAGMAVAAAKPIPPITADAIMPHDDRGPCESCHEILPSTKPVNFGLGPAGHNGMAGVNRFAFTPGGALGFPIANTVAQPGWTGATLQPLDTATAQRLQSQLPAGVLVASLLPDSSFARAGLQVDDIIFKVDGRRVASPDTLNRLFSGFAPGVGVRLSLERGGERQEVTVVVEDGVGAQGQAVALQQQTIVGRQPTNFNNENQQQTIVGRQPIPQPRRPAAGKKAPAVPTEFEWMGLDMAPIVPGAAGNKPAQRKRLGALVADVDVGSAADRAGIKVDDVLVAINGQPVATGRSLDAAIKSAVGQPGVLVEVDRGGQRMFTVLQ